MIQVEAYLIMEQIFQPKGKREGMRLELRASIYIIKSIDEWIVREIRESTYKLQVCRRQRTSLPWLLLRRQYRYSLSDRTTPTPTPTSHLLSNFFSSSFLFSLYFFLLSHG